MKSLIDWTVSYGTIKPGSGPHFLLLSFEPLEEEENLAYGEEFISYLEGDGDIGKAVLMVPHTFPDSDHVSQAITR